MPRPIHLRADWVLPMASSPIPDGEVTIEGDEIVTVRRRRVDGQPTSGVRDLGRAIIMPGLVNAHSHVEYTVLRGMLDGQAFFDWVRNLTALTRHLGSEDWIASATVGVAEAVASGITTLSDCTDSGAALDAMVAVGARGIAYQEVFGIGDDVPVGESVADLERKVTSLCRRADPALHTVGISPHSPYTVRPELMCGLAAYASSQNMPVCVHAAESDAEVELVRRGTGPMAQSLADRGIRWSVPATSVVSHLNVNGLLGPRTLLVHGVQVSAADRDAIRHSGASWAHCPRSNARLGAGVAPLRWMKACYEAGSAQVGLGTDSVVSAGAMDMFEEMRFCLMLQRAVRRTPDRPSAQDVLELATVGGARALGMADRVGALREGAAADIVALSLRGRHYEPLHDIYSAVVYGGRPADVILTMVHGRPIYDHGRLAVAGIRQATMRLRSAAARLAHEPQAALKP